jgi:hypothetical protein
VALDSFHLADAFFTSRQPTVNEIAMCAHLGERVKMREYWLGSFAIPYRHIERRSLLPCAFRCNRSESHHHVEAKYSAQLFFEDLGYEVQTEDNGWDLSAKHEAETIRIECGSTPPARLSSLGANATGFVVVAMPRFACTDLSAYLFTQPMAELL